MLKGEKFLTKMNGFIDLMNRYGADREPFLFIIDFDFKHPEIHRLNSIPSGIKFSTPLISNVSGSHMNPGPVPLQISPVGFRRYSAAFENVQESINLGNSYLLNLTFPTEVKTEFSLTDIFFASSAKYKLLYYNSFVVFSPEIFVRIQDGFIRSFPMKGTIDTNIKDAENVILNDVKEEAEHNTIVDLIRNDLGAVADKVRVTRYRYVERIRKLSGDLLQVSSEITGDLRQGYEKNLGNIIAGMLPAGSVTGAPKKETLRIIKENENYERGWYTGVFGVFDGTILDSGVMIRFIERDGDKMFFKSGGGITSQSDPVKEYDELLTKIYVPAG
jgi:para-aminobenzoate synthetase component I